MDEEDLYGHMTEGLGPDGEVTLPDAMPMAVSPRFSLAYLRESSDPVALTTTEGRVTFLNEPARRFLGLPSIEVARGRDLWEYWNEAASSALRDTLLGAGGGAPRSIPISCPAKGDDIMRHGLMASPVTDADGRIESVFIVITEPD